MFARTYAPSKAPEAVQAWRTDLQAKNRPKIAAAIASPQENPELFEEGWSEALAREQSEPAEPEISVNGSPGELSQQCTLADESLIDTVKDAVESGYVSAEAEE